MMSFFEDGPTPDSFFVFSSKFCSQQDSISDRRISRRGRWPQDHGQGHGPSTDKLMLPTWCLILSLTVIELLGSAEESRNEVLQHRQALVHLFEHPNNGVGPLNNLSGLLRGLSTVERSKKESWLEKGL